MATTTADAIAAGLRAGLGERIAYLPDRKLHALLYLAQGLYLAAGDGPLFTDPIIATETGVVVHLHGNDAEDDLADPAFGHTVFTAGRYGGLSAMDLESLIRGQGPWAATGTGQEIDRKLIEQTFREQDDLPEGTLLGYPRSARAKPHRTAGPPDTIPQVPDSREEREAFIADVRARL
jgi:uncharacterized phage-associated protein